MGKARIYFFVLVLSIFFAVDVNAAEPFLGCHEWCAATYSKAGARAVDNCVVQTQVEGFCGKQAIKVPIPTPRPTPESPTGSDSTPQQPAGSGYTCETNYESLMKQCDNAVTATDSSCDSANSSEMNSASAAALALGQQTAASVKMSCSNMANLAQAANGAVAAYRLTCSKAINTCKTSCEEVVKYVKDNPDCFTGSGSGISGMSTSAAQGTVNTAANRCNSFQSKINEANQAIQNYATTTANAQNCEEETNGGQETPAFCQQNPTYPGCSGSGVAVNCLDPSLATTNKVCVCSANPHDPMCLNGQSIASSTFGTGTIDSSSRVQSGSDNLGPGDIPEPPSIKHGPRSTGGDGEAVDGKQGAGMPVGDAGGDSNTTPRAARSGNSNEDGTPGAPSGFIGGSGGRGFGKNGTDGNTGAGRGALAGPSTTTVASAQSGNPDLRKFLPGGSYDPSRGIAGASGPDGITGPHSDIWQKVQNRYRVMRPSLLP